MFEDGISAGQRRRIAKCERAGFHVERSTVQECYPIIADNRARKGRPYSMSLRDWDAMEQHADCVRCFAVNPGKVGVAMCIQLVPEVLYVQAWGDRPNQGQMSPVVLLCKGIFEWCAEQGISVLDIGTADDDPGLIAFKQRLGFRA